MLEERIYRRDLDLIVLDMDVMQLFWKNLLIWITIPIFSHIPVSTTMCSSGVLENNLDAIYEVNTNHTLKWLLVFSMLGSVATSFLSLKIIKQSNAMQKVMLTLLKSFLMWIFFMIYPGFGHEDFNWIKMIGMFLLAIGTVWYIKLDF